MSYLKSYLAGAGFEYVALSLPPDESVYYAVKGLLSTLNQAFTIEILTPKLVHALPGVCFTIPLIFGYVYRKFKNDSPKQSSQKCLATEATSNIKNLTLAITIGFGGGYILQIIVTVMLISILLFFWLIMSLGSIAGEQDGKKLISSPVCKPVEWTEQKENRILSCRKLTLKNGEELNGIKLFSDSKIIYFITNEAAYELTTNKEVISLRKVITKPSFS